MSGQSTASQKMIAFLFGFAGSLISTSQLPLIHKLGMFSVLCVFTGLFTFVASKMSNN
ncbi:MAG: hypothetical protein PVF96_07260 [Candidatus Bathyarchaeota archaeon]|jgi:hypothetical protein